MDVSFLKIISVGIGGFLGASGRYLVSILSQALFSESSFPFGTLFVNLLGCLLIGIMGGLMEVNAWNNTEFRLFLIVGFLGGFTTFSAFANESFLLLQKGELALALLNLSFQVFCGLFLVWLGYFLVTK